MRNKAKKTMSVALSALLIAGALSAAGCKKTPDTEETLEVYCYNAGYGYNGAKICWRRLSRKIG